MTTSTAGQNPGQKLADPGTRSVFLFAVLGLLGLIWIGQTSPSENEQAVEVAAERAAAAERARVDELLCQHSSDLADAKLRANQYIMDWLCAGDL